MGDPRRYDAVKERKRYVATDVVDNPLHRPTHSTDVRGQHGAPDVNEKVRIVRPSFLTHLHRWRLCRGLDLSRLSRISTNSRMKSSDIPMSGA